MRRGVKYLAKTLSVLKTQSVLVKTQSVLVKTQCVFKSVFIFPINLRIARKYFGDVTYLRTIFQIRRFLCLPEAWNNLAVCYVHLHAPYPSPSPIRHCSFNF